MSVSTLEIFLFSNLRKLAKAEMINNEVQFISFYFHSSQEEAARLADGADQGRGSHGAGCEAGSTLVAHCPRRTQLWSVPGGRGRRRAKETCWSILPSEKLFRGNAKQIKERSTC